MSMPSKGSVALLLVTAVAILVATTASQTVIVTNQQQPTLAASPGSAESADKLQLHPQSTDANVPFPVQEGGPNLCESTSGLPPVRYPTNWTQQVDIRNPRPAYPRPSMTRSNDTWMSLNGLWQFVGGDAPLPFNQALPRCILVPYPMESDLSGIGEYHPVALYRRLIKLPDSFRGRRLLLHANRADWNATYYVNGNLAGNHLGGFDAHSFDISQFANFGGAWSEIIIRIEDPTDYGGQLIGKQRIGWLNDADLQFEVAKRDNAGKDVTPAAPIVSPPVSGLWSTVWIEATPVGAYIISAEAFPNLDTWSVAFDVRGKTDVKVNVWVTVRDAAGKQLGQHVQGLNSRSGFQLPFVAPWSPESPSLYYATISLEDPDGHAAASYDAVDIYFGFRKLELRNTTVMIPNTTTAVPHVQLNNDPTPYFWNGVLWQSYFSDGYFAGATDQQYKDFVYTVKAMGFNLLRVHGKVEDPQLYHAANTLGLAIMQDIPSACGIEAGSVDLHYGSCWTYERDVWDDQRSEQFVAETTRIVRELRRNPALAMFTAYNEGWGQHDSQAITTLIRKESPGTLVNGGSGWVHQGPGVDDVIDIHDYDTTFRGNFISPLIFPLVPPEQIIGKVPVLGEYGGTGMLVPGHYFNDNTTCRTYTSTFRGKPYSVTSTDGASLREMLTYFQDGVAGLAAQGLVGIAVYTGLSDQITECNGLWTWDFVVLKYSQSDFLVPLFKNVSDSFAKSFTFV